MQGAQQFFPWLLLYGVALLLAPQRALGKYLFVSSPQRGKVFWHNIGTVDDEAKAVGEWRPKPAPDPNAPPSSAPTPKDPALLIDSGLLVPMGLAVHPYPASLFVADQGKKSIFEYPLIPLWNYITVGTQKAVVQNVPSRWVAVDSSRNLYFSDEAASLIQIATAASTSSTGVREAKTLYAAASLSPVMVSGPGGVAVDGFFLYWTNKLEGAETGTVVKGYENPPDVPLPGQVSKLATNAMKAYGVCVSNNNVFYTGEADTVYGVKKMGGAPAEVSANMIKKPRGCAWDGDGTIYVADREGNAIYSFASNMPQMRGVHNVRKILGIGEPFGVAVYSGSRRYGGLLLPFALALLLGPIASCVLRP